MIFLHCRTWVLLGLVGLLAMFPAESVVAADVTLPDGWQQMPPAEFAAALRPIIFDTDTFENLSYEAQTGAKARGKELFLQVDLTAGEVDFPTVEVLHWLCRNELDRSVLDQSAAALLARQDDWANRPYAEVRAKIVMMMRFKIEPPAIVTEARRWVAAGGTLEQIPPADLQYERELGIFSDARYITGSFAVEWNGFVTAPATGQYHFYVCPMNVNAGVNVDPFTIKMTVSVDNLEILDSSPNFDRYHDDPTYLGDQDFPIWDDKSDSYFLTGLNPTPIKVTATIEATKDLPASALSAMLYWEGPGLEKTLVPQEALTVSGTGDSGVQATYHWKDANGIQQKLTRIEPMIDVAWTSPSIPLPEDPSIARQAVNTMWSAITDQEFLPTLLASGKVHPLLLNPDVSSASLSSVRRGQFLDILIQNPSLLDHLDLKSIVRVYEAYRFGVPGKALEVFGAWSARHADSVGEIFTDMVFQGDERFACATLAVDLTQQLPGEITKLETEYLELPDGRCSLPVAHVLGCSYLGLKQHVDWVAILDAKLANPELTGDRRVNWLLARANAAELSGATSSHYPKHYYVPFLDPRNGTKYLNQALEVAESPEVKARVAKEIVIRRTFFHEFSEAKELLQPLATSLPEPQKTHVQGWLAQMDRYIAADEQELQDQPAQARESYVKNLQLRRESAAARGDAAETARYDAIINSVSQTP